MRIEEELAAFALMAAASAVAPRRRRDDPLEHYGWVLSGAPFVEAGISGFLEGVGPRPRLRLAGDRVARLLAEIEESARGGAATAPGERYMKAMPRLARHGAGRYFTPRPTAALALDRAGFVGTAEGRLADPMCGAGAFLAEAIARLRRARPEVSLEELARRVQGVELDPLAALLARAAWLIAAAGAPRASSEPVILPVRCGDAILGDGPDAPFDFVVGNPPWVGWEHLPEDFRRRSRPLWQTYGIFTASARGAPMQHLLGGGRKDLAMLATFVAADRWLAPRGRMAFILPRSFLQAGRSAAGFRRLRLPDGIALGAEGVDDLSGPSPFGATGAPAIVLTLRKGGRTVWPIPWRVAGAKEGAAHTELRAAPADPADPASPWIAAPASKLPLLRRWIGRSAYRARAGAYTGGANGVFWVQRLAPLAGGLARVRNVPASGLRSLPTVEAPVEDALLYPLLRPRDLKAGWPPPGGTAAVWILLPQDPLRRRGIDRETMERSSPHALAYLSRFTKALARRRDRGSGRLIASGAPFYSIFSVSQETLAPWKVVWPRIASRLEAVAVGPLGGRPVVPQETLTFVPCAGEEEARYLAAILSSRLTHELAAALCQPGGKGFGAPNLLERIAIPRFEPGGPQLDDWLGGVPAGSLRRKIITAR